MTTSAEVENMRERWIAIIREQSWGDQLDGDIDILDSIASLLKQMEKPVEAVDKWVADYHEGEQDIGDIVVLAKNLAAQLESERDQIEAETVERCAHEASINGANGVVTSAIRALAQKGEPG